MHGRVDGVHTNLHCCCLFALGEAQLCAFVATLRCESGRKRVRREEPLQVSERSSGASFHWDHTDKPPPSPLPDMQTSCVHG